MSKTSYQQYVEALEKDFARVTSERDELYKKVAVLEQEAIVIRQFIADLITQSGNQSLPKE